MSEFCPDDNGGAGAKGPHVPMIDLAALDPLAPVLIAGPTASGKSGLALAIAEAQGGVIVNADALQVYADWRVLTAPMIGRLLSRASAIAEASITLRFLPRQSS